MEAAATGRAGRTAPGTARPPAKLFQIPPQLLRLDRTDRSHESPALHTTHLRLTRRRRLVNEPPSAEAPITPSASSNRKFVSSSTRSSSKFATGCGPRTASAGFLIPIPTRIGSTAASAPPAAVATRMYVGSVPKNSSSTPSRVPSSDNGMIGKFSLPRCFCNSMA